MSENYVKKTEYGDIVVTSQAIGDVVLLAVNKFNKNVILSNAKGKIPGIVEKISGADEKAFLEISFSENGLVDIKMYVILKFGMSISKTTNGIIEDIHSGVRKVLNSKPLSISVVVVGTLSKNIVKRNIEVSKHYEGE